MTRGPTSLQYTAGNPERMYDKELNTHLRESFDSKFPTQRSMSVLNPEVCRSASSDQFGIRNRVQSRLEPDPNDMTAAYMRTPIYTVNNSRDGNTANALWNEPFGLLFTHWKIRTETAAHPRRDRRPGQGYIRDLRRSGVGSRTSGSN